MKKSQEGLKLFSQNGTMQFKDEARVEKVVCRELQLRVQHTLTLLDVPSHLLAKSDFTIYYYSASMAVQGTVEKADSSLTFTGTK